ncbi:MAG: helix-turn-helix domain-containing protein [Planctomycetes bacterium]|nr:helix-turn-helix domain-containing protein [Planctomycetota bacterium]
MEGTPHTPTRYAVSAGALVVDAKGLAGLLGCGVRTIRTHDAAGKLPAPVRIGGRVVWRVSEIHDWLDADAPDRATWDARRASNRRISAP